MGVSTFAADSHREGAGTRRDLPYRPDTTTDVHAKERGLPKEVELIDEGAPLVHARKDAPRFLFLAADHGTVMSKMIEAEDPGRKAMVAFILQPKTPSIP